MYDYYLFWYLKLDLAWCLKVMNMKLEKSDFY